jgi:capsular exopolysaccharide synthesis family protein
MLEQGKQASIASAMRNSSAKVVDKALPQSAPIRPDLPSTVSLGLLGGLLCGAGFVIVKSRANLTVQTPGSLEAGLNLRELGVIPSAKVDKQLRNVRAFRRLPSANGTPRTPGTVDCLEMAATSLTPSAMAEAFRSTMTSMLLSGEGDPPKVLVFTSASPGEGKTTVVSNLAISLAQINQRVLLIDADMRLPRAHLIFDTPNNFGLSDVLNERKPIDEYLDESLVRKTHIPNLFLLSAGPARTNLSRLFHSTRMNELLARFRDMFDIVLIDTAPVLVVPDSRILARRSDAVVLVVRAHQTHQAAAFAAANRFASDGTRVLGTILNDWNPRSATHSYGGYYAKKGYGYYPDK